MPSKKRYFKRVCWYLFFLGLTSPHVIYLKKEMYNSLQLNWSLLKRVSSSIKIFPMNTSEDGFLCLSLYQSPSHWQVFLMSSTKIEK